MFMATAVLVRTGQLDLASRMLIKYAARLQRPDGIFMHASDGPVAWGRGNGFAAFGAMEALSAMPATHPLRPQILSMLHRQMAALKTMQAPDGMWREVIDERGSYRELTATAMIFSAMVRVARSIVCTGCSSRLARARRAYRRRWVARGCVRRHRRRCDEGVLLEQEGDQRDGRSRRRDGADGGY
jgi:rhamnogalacturonyl hydrolase YesR